MLALLGNMGDESPELTTKVIVDDVLAASDGELAKERRYRQLVILSQLRKFNPQIIANMKLADFFKKEKTFFT